MPKKNIIYLKFLLMKIFFSTNLILSIRILYMLQFNISYGQISLIKAIFTLTITLFELPTGIIADKVSRKSSLLISALLFSLHAIFYIISPNFIGFLMTQICLGLTQAFMSGADSAYLHDYISQNTEDSYLNVQGKIRFYSTFGSAAFAILGSILFTINNNLNFAIMSIMGIMAFFTILSLPSIKIEHAESCDKSIFSDYCIQAKNSVLYLLNNKYLFKITIISAINFSFIIFNFEFYQILLKQHNFPTKFNGMLYASFMLLMGYGAKISKNVIKKFDTYTSFRIYMILIGFSYLLFSKSTTLIPVFVGIIIQQVCFGSWSLIVENIVLEECPGINMKSTMSSLNSLVTNLIKSLLIILLGFIANKLGYNSAYIIMASILGIIVVFSTLINKNKRKKVCCDKTNNI